MSTTPDDVTQWLGRLADGDQSAAERLWQRYFERLVRLARRKLGDHNRRMADEEDVALSAFKSFFQANAAGRFPRLADRDDLWKLLVTITARKAVAQLRRDYSKKRGGGAVRGESIFAHNDWSDRDLGVDGVMGQEPTPEFTALVTEECQQRLDSLVEEPLRRIALLKLEGYDNHEVAAELKCSVRTVERKLRRIQEKWSLDVEP